MYGDEAFFFAFAENTDNAFLKIYVCGFYIDKFAHAHAGGIEQMQDRRVPLSQFGCRVGSREYFCISSMFRTSGKYRGILGLSSSSAGFLPICFSSKSHAKNFRMQDKRLAMVRLLSPFWRKKIEKSNKSSSSSVSSGLLFWSVKRAAFPNLVCMPISYVPINLVGRAGNLTIPQCMLTFFFLFSYLAL